ncbi:MAG: FAD binding domain-containing protein [Actinomycetota bacterium]
MKPPPFLYARPETLEQAIDLLSQSGEDAKVLAGGQSLVPLLNFRLARPSVLIDLNMIPELRSLSRNNGTLHVGAMVRQRTAELSSEVQNGCPLIPRALSFVGHLQIRARGTVGGSMAHADPAAELPAVALVTGAEFVARSHRGERVIPADEFFDGPFMTTLAPDEVLTEVRFPATEGLRAGFMELARRSGDFALGGVAALVQVDDGEVSDVRLASLGLGPSAQRLSGAEDAVRGRRLTEETLADAAAAASAEVDPFTDVHADAEYRKELAGTLVRRVLKEVSA